MAPRKAAKSTRSSGRAVKAATTAAIAKDTPKKRGRAFKVVVPASPDLTPKTRRRPRAKVREDAVEQPKKGRGRGRKAAEPAPEPVLDGAPAPKKRGRPPKAEPVVDDASAPKKRSGRPPRSAPAAAAKAAATPKRRGRPSNANLDLNRVAGPSRVSKRTPKKTATPAVGTRSSPRTSRTRAPKQTKKAPTAAPKTKQTAPKEAPKPKKRIGRPPKNAASTPTKAAEPKTKDARVAKSDPKPRKKRGMTTLDVPDRFAHAMLDHLQQLIDTEVAAAEEEEEEARNAQDADVEVDLAMEDAEATPIEQNGEVHAQSQASEEPVIIEEVIEEVIDGDDEPQELNQANQDDAHLEDNQQYPIQELGGLYAEVDPLQAAHEAASDTEVDEDEAVVVTELVQEIEIEELGDESVTEDLDIHEEINEITESAQAELFGNEQDRTLDSLFDEREVPAVPAVPAADDLGVSREIEVEDDDITPAPGPGPSPGPSPFDAAPVASMFSTAPLR